MSIGIWQTTNTEPNFERIESQSAFSGVLFVSFLTLFMILITNAMPITVFFVNEVIIFGIIYTIVSLSAILICSIIFMMQVSAYRKLSKKSSVEEIITIYKNRVCFIAFHKRFTLVTLSDLKSEEAIPFVEERLLTEKNFIFIRRWAIITLAKIGTKKAAISLVKVKDDEDPKVRHLAKLALDYIATKYDFYDQNKLYQELKLEKEFLKDKHTDFLPKIDVSNLEILELEKIPKGAKCMVSKLAINPDKFNIVACPHCLELARKDLLENWFNENGICPKCKMIVNLDECYLVKFSQE